MLCIVGRIVRECCTCAGDLAIHKKLMKDGIMRILLKLAKVGGMDTPGLTDILPSLSSCNAPLSHSLTYRLLSHPFKPPFTILFTGGKPSIEDRHQLRYLRHDHRSILHGGAKVGRGRCALLAHHPRLHEPL